MLHWFNQKRIRIRTGTTLLALVASLWLAMAAQPCLAEGAAMASANSAMAGAMPDCRDAAAAFPCNDFANLDCELPDRGPFAVALSLPFSAPTLIHTLDIALILAPASASDFISSADRCTWTSSPPLNLQHCVFLI